MSCLLKSKDLWKLKLLFAPSLIINTRCVYKYLAPPFTSKMFKIVYTQKGTHALWLPFKHLLTITKPNMKSYKNKDHNNNINFNNYYNQTTSKYLGCDLSVFSLVQYMRHHKINSLKVLGEEDFLGTYLKSLLFAVFPELSFSWCSCY